MTGNECRVLLVSGLLGTPDVAESIMAEADEQGWTEFRRIGPMLVAVAKTSNTYGTRQNNYQVTIK